MKWCPIFLIICVYTVSALQARDEIALVVKCSGRAQYKSGDKGWKDLSVAKRLYDGDEIKTGQDAMISIVFIDDKSMMKIRQESHVILNGKREKDNIIKKLSQQLGQLWLKVTHQNSQLQIETPSGIAAVKGTEFYSLVDEFGNTTIIGISGIVELFNTLGRVEIGAGQTGNAGKDSEPLVKETKGFNQWGKASESLNELEIEFENDSGEKKTLKIQYK